jgi:hypothetical protein
MGSIINAYNFIPKTEKWIRPAPGASGLRRKRQCGVPSAYEERLKKCIYSFIEVCPALHSVQGAPPVFFLVVESAPK